MLEHKQLRRIDAYIAQLGEEGIWGSRVEDESRTDTNRAALVYMGSIQSDRRPGWVGILNSGVGT